MDIRALSAVAAGLLTLAGGCNTTDGLKSASKKPDVTQPGVLPPPEGAVPAGFTPPNTSGVVPASGTQGQPQPFNIGPTAAQPAGGSARAKITSPFAAKSWPASEMEVAWRNKIAYLPDPSRNGQLGAGLAGQLFLFGGPKLQFAEADGTLTVDLVDITPRPAGQPAALPERWQFDKAMLKNLRTVDETFGKSYVLFLPWPAYKPDITKVKITARYDPDNSHPLFGMPAVVTIDTSAQFGGQVWDGTSRNYTGAPPPRDNGPKVDTLNPMPNFGNPIPLGGGSARDPRPLPVGTIPLPGPNVGLPGVPLGGGSVPLEPIGGTSYSPPTAGTGYTPPPARSSQYAPLQPVLGPTAPGAPPAGAVSPAPPAPGASPYAPLQPVLGALTPNAPPAGAAPVEPLIMTLDRK